MATVKISECKRRYDFHGVDLNPGTGTVQVPPGGSFRDLNWQNSRIAANLPGNWQEIIKRGGDATTSLHGFKRELMVTPVTVRCNTGPAVCERTGYWSVNQHANLDVPAPFPGGLLEDAVSKAEGQMVKHVRQARTTWSAGEPLGDIMQTIRMLKSPLKSLERLTVDAGRGTARIAERLAKHDQASARLKACTDSYLAYIFGAKPLVKDVQDAAKEVQHLLDGHQNMSIQRLIATGESSSQVQIPGQVVWMGYDGSSVITPHQDTNIVYTATARILGGYRGASRSADMAYLDSAGLAPDNWVPTLMELFPWSFVLDYFSNASSAIDALCLGEVDFSWLQQTERLTSTLVSGPIYPAPGESSGYEWCGGGMIVDRQITVARYHRASSFDSYLRFHLPNTGQALSLAALANVLEDCRKRCHN